MMTKPVFSEYSRIIAIAEYFLSLEDNSSYEHNMVMHSVEFSCQLNNLVKKGYLKQNFPKNDEFGLTFYLTTIEYQMAKEIADDFGICLFEYVKKENFIQ